jgi:hypothetical protein
MANGELNETRREANVVLAMVPHNPVSFEVLDANADDVLEAVQNHAADVALGPAVSLQMEVPTILLRFDVIAETYADVYHRVAEVMAAVTEHTDICFERSHSDVEVHEPVSDGHAVGA